MIITYLKTGEREDIENCCLRAFGPQATIFNVFSFPCFEVRDNHTLFQLCSKPTHTKTRDDLPSPSEFNSELSNLESNSSSDIQ